MKKRSYIILSIVSIFMFQISNAQQLEQTEVEQLTQVLNETVAATFSVELKADKAYCKIEQLSKTLDLRDDYAIAKDSISAKVKVKPTSDNYTEPVFWKFDFEAFTSSKVQFKSTKSKKIFCKISFSEHDTISIKSKLNAFTSTHKNSDAALHEVQWTGEKYISLLLVPRRVNNKVEIQLRGITISGKFTRSDKKELAKNYTKSLQNILKREFKTWFESEDVTQFISLKN